MLIDAHAHIDHFEDAVDAALAEIEREQILTIAVTMNPDSYRRTLDIAQQCELVLPTFGIHPWEAHTHVDSLDEIGPLIEQSPMLGEIGLDFHWVDEETFDAQRQVLRVFLEAANEQDKIVNLHTKGAEQEILDKLNSCGIQRAIIHWYSGPLEILDQMIAREFYFTIGVDVMYSDHIQRIGQMIPEEQLLTETDNPGALAWLTEEVGMPAVLHQVIDALAEVRGTSAAHVRETVHTNFARLIADDPWLSGVRGQFFGQ